MDVTVEHLEFVRRERIAYSSSSHKAEFGQFITPVSIANFMSTMFPVTNSKIIKILDPGAGLGTLSCALLNRFKIENKLSHITLDAYEIDNSIISDLKQTLYNYANPLITVNSINKDFIQDAVFSISNKLKSDYTHVIMNPPYKKINSNSLHRKLLSSVDIETVNLYSGFLALSISLLKEDGYLVAIVPRSFCNGTYYLPFRKYLMSQAKIRRIHLFKSRSSSFKDESVLQENIIIMLQKSKLDSNVLISTSEDGKFSDYDEYTVSNELIINSDDPHSYFFIPTPEDCSISCFWGSCKTTNDELGFQISTGPIVDFRIKDYLKFNYESSSVPLLYPIHFKAMKLNWPIESKRPNAISPETDEIKKSLFPKGNYILIRRFSTKEEKRRIVASIITEDDFPSDFIAVENHLNIIHNKKKGLSLELAYGLLAYFNSSFLDKKFRQFSGHTQVNATDLRSIKYPTMVQLVAIGNEILKNHLDETIVESIISKVIK